MKNDFGRPGSAATNVVVRGLVVGAVVSLAAFLASFVGSAQAADVAWRPAKELRFEGQGYGDVAAPFDRLPARAEGVVRKPVWDLSRQSAGLSVRFTTDAPEIHARWTLTSANLAMPHMPATGVSGLDLYVKLGDGKWHWLANGRPSAQTNTAVLARELGGESREYLVYLPLYNGVSSLEIGVPAGAKLEPAAARAAKPVVVWGTSITQGGCASRPGMVHTAILARRLERDVINLGFSGNGKMEPEMARFIAEIDAAAYLIDCLPNMTAAEVTERVENVVKILREKRPNAAIILAEDRTYSDAYLIKSKRERNESSRKALREAFARMQESKIPNVIYLPGEGQLGADEEGTVDSSHPTDLGFLRMADFFEPYLVKAIKLSTP